MLILGLLPAAAPTAEPRWLVRALPGAYPEIVYYVPTRHPGVALTIDDGVDPQTTPAILDVLRESGATATFFLVSDSLPDRGTLVARILREGHEIGHHMTEDEVTVRLPREELEEKFARAADVLEAFTPIRWFRPGSAFYDDDVLRLVRARGYRIALASLPPVDTVLTSPERLAALYAALAEPGSVMVLHDAGPRGQRTAEVLRSLLPALRDKGLAVMSLSALDATVGSSGDSERAAIETEMLDGRDSRTVLQPGSTGSAR